MGGRLTVYFNDPSQPKVSVKLRGAEGWESRSVGILKPCRSRDFLHHSKGYDRQPPAMLDAQNLLASPKSHQPSSPQGNDTSPSMSPQRFFVPLHPKDALPTRGPDLDFAKTSPPSARRRVHSGIPLSYRTPRAMELVRNAWSSALQTNANGPQESASSATTFLENDVIGEQTLQALPEIEDG